MGKIRMGERITTGLPVIDSVTTEPVENSAFKYIEVPVKVEKEVFVEKTVEVPVEKIIEKKVDMRKYDKKLVELQNSITSQEAYTNAKVEEITDFCESLNNELSEIDKKCVAWSKEVTSNKIDMSNMSINFSQNVNELKVELAKQKAMNKYLMIAVAIACIAGVLF